MAELYTRSPWTVSTAEMSAPGTYKRVLIGGGGAGRLSAVEDESDDSETSGDSDDDEVSDSSSSEDDLHPSQGGMVYTHRAAARTMEMDCWSRDALSRHCKSSRRGSDTASVRSRRSTNGVETLPRHSLLNIFSPGQSPKGQIASVRRHHKPNHPPTRRPAKARSVSEPSLSTTASGRPRTRPAATRPHTRRENHQENDNMPSLRDIFRDLWSQPSARAKKKQPASAKTITCVSCLLPDVPSTDATHLKCEHWMCNACVKELFKLAMRDREVMPPKCCAESPIEINDVTKLFNKKFLTAWKAHYAEWSTPNPLYCSKRKCGAWIKPKFITLDLSTGRNVGTCSACNTKVCRKCRETSHKSARCPKDVATEQLLHLKEKEGWKSCYQCKEIIELESGCHHMTCRCGAEFCMLCGKPWRDAECERNCPLFPIPIEAGDNGGPAADNAHRRGGWVVLDPHAAHEVFRHQGDNDNGFYRPREDGPYPPAGQAVHVRSLRDSVLWLLDSGWLGRPLHEVPEELQDIAQQVHDADPVHVVELTRWAEGEVWRDRDPMGYRAEMEHRALHGHNREAGVAHVPLAIPEEDADLYWSRRRNRRARLRMEQV